MKEKITGRERVFGIKSGRPGKLPAVFLILLILIFSGCVSDAGEAVPTAGQAGAEENVASSGQADEGKTVAAVSQAGTGETEAAAGQAERGQRITIMLPSYNGNTYPSQEDIDAVASQMKDTEIVLEKYPEKEYFVILKTRLATGNPPDIFSIQPGYAGFNGTINLAESGYLEPLDNLPVIREIQNSSRATLLLQNRGTVYGSSVNTMAFAVLYHKDIFEKYGLKEPENWEEFLHVCEVLQRNGVQPVVEGNQKMDGYQACFYQIVANQVYGKNPEYPIRMLDGQMKFTDSKLWDEAFRRYFLLYEKKYINEDSMQMSGDEARLRFDEKKSAMFFSVLQRMELPSDPSLGAFPLPGNDAGKPMYCVIGNGSGMGISSAGRHMKKSREALNLLLERTVLSEEKPSEEYAVHRGAEENVFSSAYDKGRFFEPCNYYWKNEVEVVMQEKMTDYLAGEVTSVRDIEEAMQKEFDR